jgi:hypothetical protein
VVLRLQKKKKTGIPVFNPPRTRGGYVCFPLLSIILIALIPHNNVSIVPWARLSPMQINHDLRTMGNYYQDPEKCGIRTKRQNSEIEKRIVFITLAVTEKCHRMLK